MHVFRRQAQRAAIVTVLVTLFSLAPIFPEPALASNGGFVASAQAWVERVAGWFPGLFRKEGPPPRETFPTTITIVREEIPEPRPVWPSEASAPANAPTIIQRITEVVPGPAAIVVGVPMDLFNHQVDAIYDSMSAADSALGRRISALSEAVNTASATITNLVATTLTVSGTGTFDTASTTSLIISGAPNGLLKTSASGAVLVATAGTDYENPLTFAYPFMRSSNAVSLAFGTTTANEWSALQKFTNASSTLLSAAFAEFGGTATTTFTMDGKVGIGSTSPWGQLSVNPTSANGSAPAFVIGSSTGTSLVVTNGGNVGIGTTGPQTNLHIVNQTGGLSQIYLDTYNNSQNSVFNLRFARGTPGALQPAVNGDTLGRLDGLAFDGSNFVLGARIRMQIDGTVGANTIPSRLTFWTANSAGTLSERVRIDSAGNVGIGSTSPWGQLSVNPTSANGSAPAFVVGSSTGTSLVVTNSGYVGVGTANPQAPLTISHATGDALRIDQSITANNSDVSRIGWYANNSLRAGISLISPVASSFGLTFSTQNNGSTAERMRIDYNGSVGIGTTSPSYLMDIVGTTVVPAATLRLLGNTASYNASIRLMENASTGDVYGFSLENDVANNVFNIRAHENSQPGSVALSVLRSNGYVGIGTTSPYAKLSVVGPVVAEYFNATSTTATSTFAGGLSAASSLYVLQNGKVGVGTTSPVTTLDVVGTNGLPVNSAIAAAGILVRDSTTNYRLGLGTYSSGAWLQSANVGTSYASLSLNPNGGNVGIGTTTPNSKLAVVTSGGAITDVAEFANSTIGTTAGVNIRLGNSSGLSVSGGYAAIQAGRFDTNDRGLRLIGRGLNEAVAPASIYLDGYTGGLGGAIKFNTSSSFNSDGTERVRIDYNGNVGIGTTTPDSRLVIAGSGQSTSALSTSANLGASLVLSDTNTAGAVGSGGSLIFGGTGSGGNLGRFAAIKGLLSNSTGNSLGDLAFSTRNATGDTTLTERLRITSAGNVGIGTTSPWGQLSVNPTSANGSAPAFVVGSSTGTSLVVTNSGLVGVGTAAPSATLDVNTTGAAVSSLALRNLTNNNTYSFAVGSDKILSVAGGASNSDAVTFESTLYIGMGSNTNVGIGTTSPFAKLAVSGNLAVGSAGSDTLFVDGSGRYVGIRTTAPAVPLAVNGNAWFNGSVTLSSNGLSAANVSALSYDNQNLTISTTGGTGHILFTPISNVGVGTTDPTYKLDVYSTANSNTGRFRNNSGTASVSIVGNAASNQSLYFGSTATSTLGEIRYVNPSNRMAFFTNNTNTERLSITSEGNVGIGTTSPWRTLSVTGTVGFDGLTGSTGAGSLCLDANKQVVYNSGSDSCLSSTRATKHDIQDQTLDELAAVNALMPVSFVYNTGDTRTRFGFIAEDAAAVDPHLATYDANGNISGIDDRAIVSVVVGAIKQLWQYVTTRFDAQDARITELEAEVAALKDELGIDNDEDNAPSDDAPPDETPSQAPSASEAPATDGEAPDEAAGLSGSETEPDQPDTSDDETSELPADGAENAVDDGSGSPPPDPLPAAEG